MEPEGSLRGRGAAPSMKVQTWAPSESERIRTGTHVIAISLGNAQTFSKAHAGVSHFTVVNA